MGAPMSLAILTFGQLLIGSSIAYLTYRTLQNRQTLSYILGWLLVAWSGITHFHGLFLRMNAVWAGDLASLPGGIVHFLLLLLTINLVPLALQARQDAETFHFSSN